MLLRKESSYATPSSRIMTSPTKPVKKPAYEMIVFSHLRWDFVYQRPQHLISRLSKTRKTLFIEEPIGKGPNQSIGYEIEVVSPTLSVLKPKVDTIYDIHKILRQLQIQEVPIAWFYSPSFMELMPFIEPKKVIYDCMDELSLFKGAPTTIKEQEQELMKVANVIFTGGRSLFESKSKQQKNVHCFPSSVDLVHFKKATDEIKIPDDLKEIPKPTIGYIGVIDERIDMKLLAETAKIMPDYSFVMIGPLAKIGEADLAKGDNIHYLGMKSYNELPNYLAGLDYTMMPFALNDATRFISPTKTLEYMAAEKPIISTAIKDVVSQYSDCVKIVDSAEQFKKAVEAIENDKKRSFLPLYKNVLDTTSWDHTAMKMSELINLVVV